MLIDITRTLGLDDLAYPGDLAFSLRCAALVAKQGYALTEFSGNLHCGTHLDAPSHFIAGGVSLDELPLERFDLPCTVLDCGAADMVDSAQLAGLPPLQGRALLLRTRNAQLPRDRYTPEHCALTLPAARRLIELDASLLGIDYVSVERADDPRYPVHRLLLGAGLLLLEDVDLRHVPAGDYHLRCYPLRIAAAEAAPCRAVLEVQ